MNNTLSWPYKTYVNRAGNGGVWLYWATFYDSDIGKGVAESCEDGHGKANKAINGHKMRRLDELSLDVHHACR